MSGRARRSAAAAVVGFFLLSLFGVPGSAWAKPVTIERIVAKVNDEMITLSELQDFIKDEADKLRSNYKGAELAQRMRDLELKALNVLIENKLMLQRAKDMNLEVGEKELESALSVVKERNKLSMDELQRYLRSQGTTFEEYRKKIRERILLRKVENIEVNVRLSVSEEEIAAYYHANEDQFRKGEGRKVRQIFFPVEKEASEARREEQREKAEKAYQEVTRPGASFAEVAKKLSEGPAASRGGELGIIKKGEVFPEFEQAVFSLKKGETSRPVRTRVGYHVLHVDDVQPGKVIPLDQVAGKIRDRLFQEKHAKRRREWIAELKRAAFLEISLDPQVTTSGTGLENLFRDVREQVTFRLTKVQLLSAAEPLGRERLFWAYGSNRKEPRWKSEHLKVDDNLTLNSDMLSSLDRTYRDFVNPDPAASLFLYEYNYILPNSYLGSVNFADLIKAFSLHPKGNKLTVLTDSKRARLEFLVSVQKTRSIVADPQEIAP